MGLFGDLLEFTVKTAARTALAPLAVVEDVITWPVKANSNQELTTVKLLKDQMSDTSDVIDKIKE